jgi:putative ABC transport system permease protein
MRLIGKLLRAQFRRRWLRTLLALAALITSVAMVAVVAGGYDVAIAQAGLAEEKASGALGRFDLTVATGSPGGEAPRMRFGQWPPTPGLRPAFLSWLRSCPDVRELLEYAEMGVQACPPGEIFRQGAYRPGELLSVSFRATSGARPPYPMVMGKWVTDLGEDEVVVGAAQVSRLVPPQRQPGEAAQAQRPLRPSMPGMGGGEPPKPPADAVGATFQLITETGRHEVRIGGIIQPPYTRGFSGEMYLSPKLYENLTGCAPEINTILVNLKDGVKAEDFAEGLYSAADRAGQRIDVETVEDIRAQAGQMARMFGNRRGHSFFPLLRNAGMNLAILAAMFIIFSTLNMGLKERSRQLAMLRAIGMTRGQVMALIATEAFLLALAGWLAGVGVGWGVMRYTIADLPGLAGRNVPRQVGLWLGLGALTAFGATFAAAVLPMLLALRRKPLDDIEGAPLLRSARPPLWTIPPGLILIAANPVITILTPLASESWRETLTTVGTPLTCLGAILGFTLIMPVLVVACERGFGRPVAWLFGLNPRLLSKQLSAGRWRTVGCATALMVGLGLYVTVQVWGRSMLRPFLVTSSQRSPDAFVTILPKDMPRDRIGEVRRLDGVENVVPLILRYPKVTNIPKTVRVGGIFTENMIYVGCDVRALLGEESGIMGVSFIRGNQADAWAKLAQGGACLITDGLYWRAPQQFDVGRTIALDTSDGGATEHVEHEVAGVIEMPGWQLMSKSTHMRRDGLGPRVGAMVIVPEATATEIYPGAGYKTFWFRLAQGVKANSLEVPMIRIVDPTAKVSAPPTRGGPGGPSGPSGTAIKRAGPGGRDGRGRPGPRIESEYYARVTDKNDMTAQIKNRADGIIESMTLYPLMALGLSALAVVGTMITSVRVRTWELGVLRSLGLMRGQLLRQVLAEGLLIGLLACVASLLFGLLASWTGVYVSTQHWGVHAPMVIPWTTVLLGIGMTIALCVAASLWPALTACFRQPLRLLQEGRAAE